MLSTYDSKKVEQELSREWVEKEVFKFNPNSKKPFFVIDSPPPFPTGEFHIGGVLNWCYFDFAARYKRMKGFEVLLTQGWDCHGFPTEVKVEKKYGRLPRKEFVEKCEEWTHEVISTMKPQMQQLGYSIDWSREYFTTSRDYKKAVQFSLVKMLEQGNVYRAKHEVLWCTACGSAIAKAETEEEQRETTLNYVEFTDVNGKPFQIATTRPELMHSCVGVAVHPMDERYKKIGKEVTTALGKKVKVIADHDVDASFGTGAVMVCSFGDKQDATWVRRHSLPIIDAMDHYGKLINAGEFNGLKAQEARKKVLEKFGREEKLKKQERLSQTVKIHDRCKKPIELLRSTQWFIKVRDHFSLIEKNAKEIAWIPPHSLQLLLDWLNALEYDWCISRQRFYGVPIPFWHCEKCSSILAPKLSELPVVPSEVGVKRCKCGGEAIPESSICDGWVDSSITPLMIAGWKPEMSYEERSKFNDLYPSSLRPQGTDIIRTWAFYTILRCSLLEGKPPFKEVLINGMVQGQDGKKMSKSLGNYVEAKEVLAKASVDSLRQWVALSGNTGKDNMFRWQEIDRAKSFTTKLWNACVFAEKVGAFGKHAKPSKLEITDKWVLSRLQKTIQGMTERMEEYDYYGAITLLHSFVWNDFCDYYLEDVKHRVYGRDEERKAGARFALGEVIGKSLRMFSIFAPFFTSYLYKLLYSREAHSEAWPLPEGGYLNEEAENNAALLHEVVVQVRKFKASNSVPLNEFVAGAEISCSNEVSKRISALEGELKEVCKINSLSLKPIDGAEGIVKVELRKSG